MAIVKGPALSLQASGNVGSICYSTYRGQAVARSAWSGTVPNTAAQQTQQAYITAVSQDWGTVLTTAQRDTYNRLAKSTVWRNRFGDPYIPNGYQLFMKLNVRRRVCGQATMLIAPPETEWAYVSHLIVQFIVGLTKIATRLSAAYPAFPASYGVEYWLAGPYDSGGRKPIEGEWRFEIRREPPNFAYTGVVIIDKWYWVRARAYNEFGGVQNWFQMQVYTG